MNYNSPVISRLNMRTLYLIALLVLGQMGAVLHASDHANDPSHAEEACALCLQGKQFDHAPVPADAHSIITPAAQHSAPAKLHSVHHNIVFCLRNRGPPART